MGQLDLQDLQDLWEYLVLQVSQELWVMLAHKEMLDHLDFLEQKVTKVNVEIFSPMQWYGQ